MKKLSILLAATLILNISAGAFAACDWKSNLKCPLSNAQKTLLSQNAKLYADLCMTDAQKTKANQIFDKKTTELANLNKQIQEKQALLKKLSDSKTQKTSIQKEITALIAEKQAINEKYNKQFEAGLTTKQKQKLQLIKATYQLFQMQ